MPDWNSLQNALFIACRCPLHALLRPKTWSHCENLRTYCQKNGQEFLFLFDLAFFCWNRREKPTARHFEICHRCHRRQTFQQTENKCHLLCTFCLFFQQQMDICLIFMSVLADVLKCQCTLVIIYGIIVINNILCKDLEIGFVLKAKKKREHCHHKQMLLVQFIECSLFILYTIATNHCLSDPDEFEHSQNSRTIETMQWKTATAKLLSRNCMLYAGDGWPFGPYIDAPYVVNMVFLCACKYAESFWLIFDCLLYQNSFI